MVKIGGIHNNNNNTVSFNPTYNQVYMDQLWSIGSKLEKKKGVPQVVKIEVPQKSKFILFLSPTNQ